MTLTRKAIEEAISDVQDGNENRHNRGCSILIELAQEYLAIKGMPEEREVTQTNIDNRARFYGDVDYEDLRNDGFNSALSLCKLAHAKNCQECKERVPTIKELNKIVRENEEYSSSDDRIATAIHTLITGKRGGE